MRNWMLLMLLAGALALAGCKAKQAVTTDASSRATDLPKLLEKVESNRLQFKILTFKGKADYIDVASGKSTGFSYRIDIAKDSLILVNISKFGLPAMNMLISRDTVKLRMPLTQTAMICDYTLLQKMAKIDLNFIKFQSLLIGEAVLEQPLQLVDGRGAHVTLQGERPPYSVYWILNSSHYRLEKMRISDPNLGSESLITYGDFKKVDGQMVASEFSLEATTAQKLRIELHHSGIEFDQEKVNFQYRIPESYKIQPCDKPIQGQ